MSPTFLEVTLAVVAAVLVFLFALRAVPLVVEYLSQYFDKTLDGGNADQKDPNNYDH